MKKILLLPLIFSYTLTLMAQDTAEVITVDYEHVLMMDTVGIYPVSSKATLYIDIAKKTSVYHWDRTNKKYTREYQKNDDGTVKVVYKNGGSGYDSIGRVVYQKQSSNILTLRSMKNYEWFIMEDTVTINWTITDSTKVYYDMHLQKAECDFRGRHYTAWFNPEIAYSGGPWKLKGLPGLIIEAYDEKKHVMFNFQSIKQSTIQRKALEPPTDGQAINVSIFRAEVKEIEKNFDRDFDAKLKQMGITEHNLITRKNSIER